MLVTLEMFLGTVLLPPGGLVLLAGAGLWLLARGRAGGGARRAGWALVIASLAALWLLSTSVVADGLTRLAERYPPLDLSRPVRAQAIVILGGGSARMAPEYGGPAMRETLARDFGITPRWVDDASRDTFDNARLSARLLGADGMIRVFLVTSSYHEWRAVQEFESAGITVEPAPEQVWAPRPRGMLDYWPEPQGLLRSTEALHEILGDAARALLAASQLRRHGPRNARGA